MVFERVQLWFKFDPVLTYSMDAPGVENKSPSASEAASLPDVPATPLKKPASKLVKAKAKASPKVPPTPPTPMKAMKASKKPKKEVQSKTGAKPVVKAKASAKKGMKRPAAVVVPAVQPVQPVMKKPASGVGSSKSGAPSWSIGFQAETATDHEGGEEETPEVDEVESVDKFETDNEQRDRVKNNKFRLLLSQGSLPNWVKKAWQQTETMKVGRCAAQTKIINNVLTRDSKGALKVELNAPALTELKAGFGSSFLCYMRMLLCV